MFIADLHMHSHYSDGQLSIRQLIDLMGENGLGAIAITDHLCEEATFLGKAARFLGKSLSQNNFTDYLEEIQQESERAWAKYKMLVIPGVEITKNSMSHKNSAHIVALNIHQYISPDLPLRAIIDEIHRQGGIAIAAHPVHTQKSEHQTYQLWNHREELAPHIDAWEVASGKNLFQQVKDSGLHMIANSDLHHPQQIESWKTQFNCEKNFPSICHAIHKQNIDFYYFNPGIGRLKNIFAKFQMEGTRPFLRA